MSALSACGAPTIVREGNEAEWSFIVLPDTQYYASTYPDILESQIEFILQRRDALGIQFVLHEGDVTDNDAPLEWQRASDAFARLDGVVPYAIVPGNHDYAGNAASRAGSFNDYFPVARFDRLGTLLRAYDDRSDNAAHRFQTPEGPWLVVGLEFGPRAEVVRWARELLDIERGTPAMLLTHAFLYSDGTRYDCTSDAQPWCPGAYGIAAHPGGASDGERMYEALVAPFDDVLMTWCGHVHDGGGAARRTDEREDGSLAHQILADYQSMQLGGGGYLRIVRSRPDAFEVSTYSPYLDRWMRDDANEFELPRHRMIDADPGVLDRR